MTEDSAAHVDESDMADASHMLAFTRVVAPTGTLTASAGGTGNVSGTVTYRMTFVSPAGETESGVASNTITVANKSVNLANVQTSADPAVTARRIYRTPPGEVATEMGRLVGQIDDNTSTTWTDNVADSALGKRVPWFNTTGGDITLNGNPYLGTGFSTRFGVNCMPLNSPYACTAMGVNAAPLAERVLRSEFYGVDAGEHVVSGEGLNLFGTHAGGALVNARDTTAIGYGALQKATGAVGVIAIGRAALSEAIGTVTNVVAVGAYALQELTTGANNVAVGQGAGFGVKTGAGNTLLGSFTGRALSGGNFNSLFGFQAGVDGTGNGNAGLGAFALSGLTTGDDNTAVGTNAGKSITTGAANTFVGTNAGNGTAQKVDAFYSTVIGHAAQSTRDRELVLGAAAFTDHVVIAGVSFTKAQIAALLDLVDGP